MSSTSSSSFYLPPSGNGSLEQQRQQEETPRHRSADNSSEMAAATATAAEWEEEVRNGTYWSREVDLGGRNGTAFHAVDDFNATSRVSDFTDVSAGMFAPDPANDSDLMTAATPTAFNSSANHNLSEPLETVFVHFGDPAAATDEEASSSSSDPLLEGALEQNKILAASVGVALAMLLVLCLLCAARALRWEERLLDMLEKKKKRKGPLLGGGWDEEGGAPREILVLPGNRAASPVELSFAGMLDVKEGGGGYHYSPFQERELCRKLDSNYFHPGGIPPSGVPRKRSFEKEGGDDGRMNGSADLRRH